MEHLATFDKIGYEIANYLSEITGFEISESRGSNPNHPLQFRVGNSQAFESGTITPEVFGNYPGKPDYLGRYLVALSNHVNFHVFIKYDGLAVLMQAGREVILNRESFRKSTHFASCDSPDPRIEHTDSDVSIDRIYLEHCCQNEQQET